MPTDHLCATSTYLTCRYLLFTRYQHTPHLYITSDPPKGRINLACLFLGPVPLFRCVKVMVLLYYLQTLPRECDSGRCHGDTLWVPVAASDCATGSQGARDGGAGTALA